MDTINCLKIPQPITRPLDSIVPKSNELSCCASRERQQGNRQGNKKQKLQQCADAAVKYVVRTDSGAVGSAGTAI